MSDPQMPAPLGDPEKLRAAAADMRRLGSGLDVLADHVTGTARRLYGEAWRGPASVAFLDHSDHLQWIMRQCGERAGEYAKVCEQWADELQAARDKFVASEAILDQASELHSSGDSTETQEQAQRRQEAAADVMYQGYDLRLAAIADAEAAAQDAAGRFVAIAPPAFGALTDDLFGPDGTVAALARGLDDGSDALSVGGEALEQMTAIDAERMRWASRLGSVGTLVKWARILGPAGDVAGVVGAGLEQYAEDMNNPVLRDQDRIVRAVEDGVVRGGGANVAGNATGTAAGALTTIATGGNVIAGGVASVIGDAVGSEVADQRIENQLDRARHEAGVPAEQSVLPEGNSVVEPPEKPPPPKLESRPVAMPNPESDDAMGIRRHHPTLEQQESARQEARQGWTAMQEALREGVPEPQPAPALPHPGPPPTG